MRREQRARALAEGPRLEARAEMAESNLRTLLATAAAARRRDARRGLRDGGDPRRPQGRRARPRSKRPPRGSPTQLSAEAAAPGAARPSSSPSRRRRGRGRSPRAQVLAAHFSTTPSCSALPDATTGQRGWNRHPGGIFVGSGGSPSRTGRSMPPASGTTSSRARVYGCRGRRSTSSVGPSSTIRPRYITATRSATVQARPRSWVTMMIDSPRSVAELHQQLKDLSAHGCVEVRHRLVGDDDLRLQRERPGDHHALSLTARQLVRVRQEEAFRGTKARARQRAADELLLGLAVRSLR